MFADAALRRVRLRMVCGDAAEVFGTVTAGELACATLERITALVEA